MHVRSRTKPAGRGALLGAARAALVVCCVFGWTLSLGGVAQASFTQVGTFGSSGSSDGQFSTPWGVAVDQLSGDVYVADLANNRVEEFESSGTYLSQFAAPGAAGVAVDPECGGDIYVTDLIGNVVNQYSASGSLLATFGSSGSGNGQFNEPVAVAVDPTSGDLYVAEAGNHRVQKLSCSGAYISQITTDLSEPATVAVDSAGDLYVADPSEGAVQEFDASGNFLSTLESGDPRSLAIDASDHVFVQDQSMGGILEFSSGSQIANFTSAQTPVFSFGMAFGDAVGVLYAADAENNDVVEYGPLVARAPSVDEESHAAVTPVAATLGAKVNPNDADTTCQFEYVDTADYNALAPNPYSAGATAPCTPADLGPGTADVAASTEISGLQPSTTYHYRLVATNSVDTTDGEDQTLTTLPSVSIDAIAAAKVGQTVAELSAELNPNGADTVCQFEYVDTADYNALAPNPYSAGATAPCTPADLGPGTADVAASTEISGLQPSTTYHYRLVARNSFGADKSVDHAFTTFPSGSPFQLPDGRAYEQVTPVDKDGGNASGGSNLVESSPSGERVTFFSAAGLPGGTGAQEFPLFLASRTNDGWSTQGLLPSASVASSAEVLGWSADLSQVFEYGSAETAGTTLYTLYARASADGSLRTISGPSAATEYQVAASTPEGSDVIFEAEGGAPLLPKAAAGQDNLYAWDNGQLSLVGVLPASQGGGAPPGGSFAGPYDWEGSDPGRGGGAAGYYTQETLSTDGSRMFWTAGGTGQLYVRENGTTTAQVSASQKTNGSGPGGTDVNGPKPAAFMAATPDGSHAFFTSPRS